jgi:hypothetical protein
VTLWKKKNRYWVLAKRPSGNDYASALELVEEEIAPLVDGDVLIRNAYFSLDAGTRMWMTAREDSYSPPTPLNSLNLGILIFVLGIWLVLMDNGLITRFPDPMKPMWNELIENLMIFVNT